MLLPGLRSLGLAALFLTPLLQSQAQQATSDLSKARIDQIAAWLPERPAGIGRPITDRAYWENPRLVAHVKKTTASADGMLTRQFPAWNDDDYLDFSRTGQRPRGEHMIGQRHGWLTPLVLAECVENKGRFVPLLNQVLESYAQEPTWSLPAHDPHVNYLKKQYDVDLGSSSFGHEMAEALFLLGDRVQPAVRQHVMADLKERVFDPVVKSVNTGKGCWWLRGTNNWTAVCLAGAVGANLAVEPDRAARAMFAATGEHYIQNFVRGFKPGGYCEEGVGYWGYGFSHYIILRQELAEATAGKLDLFSDPRSADMALFGVRIRIGKDTVPYFEDCHFGTKPNAGCLAYCNDVFHLGLGLSPFDEMPPAATIEETLMKPFPLTNTATDKSRYTVDPLRSYFSSVGVLCDRPAPGGACKLGIGIKAGGNGSHSHNDVGSYDIAWDEEVPTGDPGGPAYYDSKTFGPERYTRKLLNSFGHPVPILAGQLQIDATKAHPVVISTNFTPMSDEIKMDITSAYKVPALRNVDRTMDYSRSGSGEINIADTFAFTQPSTVEDTLITDGDWKQVDDHTVMLTMGSATLKVSIQTPDGFTIKSEKVQEMGALAFTHIGLVLNRPLLSGTVAMRFVPAE